MHSDIFTPQELDVLLESLDIGMGGATEEEKQKWIRHCDSVITEHKLIQSVLKGECVPYTSLMVGDYGFGWSYELA